MPASPLDPATWLATDRELLWHPYTSLAAPTPTRLVTGADGVRLELAGYGWVLDAMSSWWSVIHGYRHPALTRALSDQADDFAHVMFGGLTHRPAIRLAEQLTSLTGLDHVFLADSGSVGVEVALKMARQYQRGTARPERTRLLAFEGGYHGDTLGCMSVTDPVGGMHAIWADALPTQRFAPRPPGTEATEQEVTDWAEAVRREAAAGDVAGIIVEPLLQGAGGMWTYPAERLELLRRVADEHDLVLIFDEIATGFGRLGGELFAAQLAGVQPDVMCLGKALTGGTLTMSAVLCTRRVAAGIGASEAGVLMHGPTFMGNPLACAVASANLDLLATGQWRSQVTSIGAALESGLAPLRDHPRVAAVRVSGAVGVVQLDHPVDVLAATEAALAAGVWLRPFRDLVYAMPPYPCTPEVIGTITSAMAAAAEAG